MVPFCTGLRMMNCTEIPRSPSDGHKNTVSIWTRSCSLISRTWLRELSVSDTKQYTHLARFTLVTQLFLVSVWLKWSSRLTGQQDCWFDFCVVFETTSTQLMCHVPHRAWSASAPCPSTSPSLLFPSVRTSTTTPPTGLLFGRFAEKSPLTEDRRVEGFRRVESPKVGGLNLEKVWAKKGTPASEPEGGETQPRIVGAKKGGAQRSVFLKFGSSKAGEAPKMRRRVVGARRRGAGWRSEK